MLCNTFGVHRTWLRARGWSFIAALVLASVASAQPPADGAGARGATWLIQTTPNPVGAELSQLEAVACPTLTLCFAVGYYSKGTATAPLVESWNGKAWAIEPVPVPQGASTADFYAVRCSSPTRCTAVGSYDNRAGVSVPLAEAWTGKTWAIETVPSPTNAKASSLFGVACVSATSCTAVGDYQNAQDASLGFAEGWNGKKWSVQKLPNPSGAQASQLAGVECLGHVCTAVGSYRGRGGSESPLVEVWDGHAWARAAPLVPTGADFAELASVRCGSATSCMAVGSYQTSNGANVTLAELSDGKKWILESTPNPKGASSSYLDGVKCTSPANCEAVGYYQKGANNFTLAEAWDGKAWMVQATPNEHSAASSFLYAVGCSRAAECSAVASYERGGRTFTLAERYAG